MIVFRYLSREVLLTLSAVSAVLLVIIMSGRFIKYLAQAASGLLDPGSLFLIMGFRLPGFLQLILPLGLFLGILLSYGRLYLESEMTVLSATGMSQQRLFRMTLFPATLVALVVAWLSLSLAPQGANQFQLLLNKQDALTEFDTLEPGRFQALRDGTRVTYTESMSDDRVNLGGVFISQKNISSNNKDRGISVLVAEKGRQEIRPDGNRYLILDNGYRYDGSPGQADYRAIKYDEYGVLLPKPEVSDEVTDRDAMPTRTLIGSDDIRIARRAAMAHVSAVAGVHRDPDGGAAVAGQSAPGPFPQAAAGDSSLYGLPDHPDCRPRRPRKGQDPAGVGLVVGARDLPGPSAWACSTGSRCA